MKVDQFMLNIEWGGEGEGIWSLKNVHWTEVNTSVSKKFVHIIEVTNALWVELVGFWLYSERVLSSLCSSPLNKNQQFDFHVLKQSNDIYQNDSPFIISCITKLLRYNIYYISKMFSEMWALLLKSKLTSFGG